MRIQREYYKLIKKDIPLISNNIIEKDLNVGGIKLVYQKYIVTYLIFNLFGSRIIPIEKQKKEKVIFVKPYKKYFDKNILKLPNHKIQYNLWGKRTSPLTHIWCKTSDDYINIKGDYISKKIKRGPIYKNQRVIKILDKHPKSFTIEIGIL